MLDVKNDYVIIVMRNSFLAITAKGHSCSWLKIFHHSHHLILVKWMGHFDLGHKVILMGGEWYVLKMHGAQVSSDGYGLR